MITTTTTTIIIIIINCSVPLHIQCGQVSLLGSVSDLYAFYKTCWDEVYRLELEDKKQTSKRGRNHITIGQESKNTLTHSLSLSLSPG